MRKNKKTLLFCIVTFLLTSIFICIPVGSIPDMFAASSDNLQLIEIKTRNIDETGFDLVFTVNNTAVLNGASVVFAYTTDINLKVTPDNIADLTNTTTIQLSEMKTVAKRTYQSVFSVSISTASANSYYIYAMLKTDNDSTDVSTYTLNYGKDFSHYTYTVPSPSPTPTPTPTATPTSAPTATTLL